MQEICSEVLSSLRTLSEGLTSVDSADSQELCRLKDLIDRLSEQLPSLRSYVEERYRELLAQEKRSASPSSFLSERLALQKKMGEMLTLNDRFRFSAELFGGSMQRLAECVERIDELGSREEAEACFRECTDVKSGSAFREFMEILAAVHFEE